MQTLIEQHAAGEGAGLASWTWSQRWRDLLFLHWKAPAAALSPHLPAPLELDMWQGEAWLSLVILRLQIRPRWLPFIPGVSFLVEANLRTYVRHRARPGIYFLSIHADNCLSAWLARRLSPLPYHFARLFYRRRGDTLHFERRTSSVLKRRVFMELQLIGPGHQPAADSLDAWLLERYRAYAWSGPRMLVAAEVTHPPWTVRQAKVVRAAGGKDVWWDPVPRCSPDLLHWSDGVDALFGRFHSAAEA